MNGTSTFLASCHEYFVNGERKNGTFRIRPNISLPSFEVNCLFGNESAVTEITPVNLPESGLVFPKNESERCSEPNCFIKSVQYHPSLDQIEVKINYFSMNYFLKDIQNVTCNIQSHVYLVYYILNSGTYQFIGKLFANCGALLSSDFSVWIFFLVRSKR